VRAVLVATEAPSGEAFHAGPLQLAGFHVDAAHVEDSETVVPGELDSAAAAGPWSRKTWPASAFAVMTLAMPWPSTSGLPTGPGLAP
jgi:hypothetical protein